MVGMIEFFSITVRAFKLDLEDRCEDYGQIAVYNGTIKGNENFFILDDHHLFEKNKPMSVCQNTAKMISETRFGEHFKLIGTTETHFGLFDCAPKSNSKSDDCSKGACC